VGETYIGLTSGKEPEGVSEVRSRLGCLNRVGGMLVVGWL